ncbi:MAG: hypothetical protein ACN6NW_05795 [Acinetobacter amyesii]|uniref:hypothetical protein n=1 Tax=Acinetobacter amyesii TaxID=2942470 RepID=UPI00321E213E
MGTYRNYKGNHGYQIREIVLKLGHVIRKYFYKNKQAYRVLLTSKLSLRLAGLALIEKDIRNIISWLNYIEYLYGEDKKEGILIASDRDKFNIVKGLYVAFLASYGKCFTNCKGRNAQLERSNLDPKYHQLHDELMRQRHNYVAHSGDDKVESAEIALVFPQQRNAIDKVQIFTELFQPDYMNGFNETDTLDLVNHMHALVQTKISDLTTKIMKEEVFIKSYDEWKKIGKDSIK